MKAAGMAAGALLAGICATAFAADSDDNTKTLASKITEVTVYADRARVTRVGSVDIGGGVNRFAFRKLPGWVDDASVRLTVSPSDSVEILDVRVEKTFLTESSEEEVRKGEAAVRETSDQLVTLADEIAVLDSEARQIEAIRAFSLDKLPKDMATRDVKVASFAETVDFVGERLRKNTKAKRELEKKRRDLQPELDARTRKLGELRTRAQLEQRAVLVDLRGTSAKKATLTLTYMLPGATWEPVAELRASPEAKSVTLAQYAVLTQTTGEDWDGAAITLSTQSTSDTMKVPELEALLLGGGTALSKLVTPADSFKRAQGTYSSQNSYFRSGQSDYSSNLALQMETQQRVEVVFRALQDRGTTAQFQAAGAQTVRADGRSVRVAIGNTELAAAHKIMAAPEVSLNAARTVDLVNTGKQPLLPGKVSLYLDGAFLGTTELGFVAQGEPFSMFVGVADRIKLARALDKKRSSLERGGKRTRIMVSYLVTAENLSDKPMLVRMNDRVPVSQTEEIKIGSVKIAPEGLRPDGKGLLHWDLTLAPKQSQSYRIEYALEYPTDLIARARMMEAQNPAPAAAERSKKNEINYEDLEQLEIMTK